MKVYITKTSDILELEKMEAIAPQSLKPFSHIILKSDHDRELKAKDEVLKLAVSALEEIANDEEESSHERAENALWAAKSALTEIKAGK